LHDNAAMTLQLREITATIGDVALFSHKGATRASPRFLLMMFSEYVTSPHDFLSRAMRDSG